MAEIEFELVFALPEGDNDAFELMDAVFEAGFEDAIVGAGVPGMIGIAGSASDHAEDAIPERRALIRNSFLLGLYCVKCARTWSALLMWQSGST
ncbi:MAG: hypothetical protein R3D85_16200 [Paracoccaceae bacterium]